MGLNISVISCSSQDMVSRSMFGRSSDSTFNKTTSSKGDGIRKGNPDPGDYKIKNLRYINGYLIIFINYPNCDNYEGNKILIFRNVTLTELKKQKLIDPHFCDSSKFHSPIARFVPTEEGWDMAMKFCEEYRK
jgi:hypothetical protein